MASCSDFAFLQLPPSVQQEQLERFKGICALYGFEGFLRLQNAHVVVLGNGGVGSWIAESLCRTGVGALTLLDFDTIELSNSNRQLHTLSTTLGTSKAQTLGARLCAINPYLKLKTIEVQLTKDNVAQHLAQALGTSPEALRACRATPLETIAEPQALAQQRLRALYEEHTTVCPKTGLPLNVYVAEAIDDLFAKASAVDLLHRAHIPLVTSGGAGGRIDPSRVRLGDVSSAKGDQLIKRLRTELRRNYGYPKGADDAPKKAKPNSERFNIWCSYSDEKPLRAHDRALSDRTPDELGLETTPSLPAFGASVTVTATAGLLLASVIIRWIVGERV